MNKQATHIASILALALSTVTLSSIAHAHGAAGHDKPHAMAPISPEETAFGKQGDPKKVTRTITIDMLDTMRFGPADLRIKQGETIRFVVRNKGKMMHEMVLGTMEELKEHGAMMQKHPDMEHDEPHMTHVGPGKKENMIWHFTKTGEFHYACLLPGHFEAGMVGRITVVPN